MTGIRALSKNDPDYPGLSEDGKYIALQQSEDTGIAIEDTGTGTQSLLGNGPFDMYPAWSPSGGQIAYISSANNNSATICIIDIRSKKTRKIPALRGAARSFAWSPDGKRLAAWTGGESSGRIYVVDVKTSKVTRLSTPDIQGVLLPAWSYDGRQIVYVGDDITNLGDSMPEGNPYGSHLLWITDIATGKYRQLTFGSWFMSVFDASDSQDLYPQWSRDGRWIAYDWSSDKIGAEREIRVISSDGKKQATVYKGNYRHLYGWSKNGKGIVFGDYPISSQDSDVSIGLLSGEGFTP